MLNAVVLLCTLAVVESVECSYKVACDSANPVKSNIVCMLFSSAARAGISDNACVSTARVAVNRVVDRTVAHARFLHAADHRLKGRRIL